MVPLPSMIILIQAKNTLHSALTGMMGAFVFDSRTYSKVSNNKSIEGFFLSFIWWVVFTFSGYIISFLFTFKLPERSRQTEIARLTAFAQTPGILWIFGVIPHIGIAVTNTAAIWQMATTTVAIKHSLKDRTHWRAIASTLVGFLLWLAVINIFKS